MADVKENAMGGGVPARIRALDAAGNSISPTMNEFISFIPDKLTAYGVAELYGYTIFASCEITFVGSLIVSMGTQDSIYNNYWAMLYIMARAGVPSVRINSLISSSINVSYYYKEENGKLLFAAKDMSGWNHVATTSFCEKIMPIFKKISSIEGWIAIK